MAEQAAKRTKTVTASSSSKSHSSNQPKITANGIQPNGKKAAPKYRPGMEVLFDHQGSAPAPNNSYFQVLCQSKPDRQLILREWPRQRMSGPKQDPVQLTISWDDYLSQGEIYDKIIYVFGTKVADRITEAMEKYQADDK